MGNYYATAVKSKCIITLQIDNQESKLNNIIRRNHFKSKHF